MAASSSNRYRKRVCFIGRLKYCTVHYRNAPEQPANNTASAATASAHTIIKAVPIATSRLVPATRSVFPTFCPEWLAAPGKTGGSVTSHWKPHTGQRFTPLPLMNVTSFLHWGQNALRSLIAETDLVTTDRICQHTTRSQDDRSITQQRTRAS